MFIAREELLKGAREAGASEDLAVRIWNNLSAKTEQQPSLRATHIAYYLGALIIAGAMGWFVTQAFDSFSGGALTAIATAYAVVALLAARYFRRRPELRVLGGICATVAVCMTPLGVFGPEKAFHLWPSGVAGAYSDFHPYIRASWVYMEVATVIAGWIALRWIAFPFLTAPIAYALWYLSMDGTELLFHSHWTYRQECLVSIVFGSVMLIASFLIDRRMRDDYAFWGYLFGMLTLWGGLSLLDSGSQVSRFFYCLLNVGFIILSPLLNRRVFLIFGSLGVFGYLVSLAYSVFRNSLLFPFALSILGIAVIALGVFLQKKLPATQEYMEAHLPAGLMRAMPGHRPVSG